MTNRDSATLAIATTPQPLRKSRPEIGWLATRCLQAPPHPLACQRCVDACPAKALAFQEQDNGSVALRASEACHGCAQCVAACPTEALIGEEVETLLDASLSGQSLRLECHRTADAPDPTRLHCLRALGPDLLAWLSVRAMPGEVTLRVPEACRDCLAAPESTEDNWLDQARAICSLQETEAHRDYAPAGSALSRRRFLLGQGIPRLPTIAEGDTAPRARRLARQAAAIEALGGPALPLPGLTLEADACHAHGVCARVCPTDALQETSDGDLVFDPRACLDCGHCLTACPEQALSMSHAPAPVTVTLRQGQTLACFECRRPFSASRDVMASDTPVCPACRREQALLRESFHDLFG